MKISIVGTGYVGLVAGACLADSGNEVLCIDSNQEKIDGLKRGEIPIYEPGLQDIVKRNAEAGNLRFTTSLEEGVDFGKAIFIAVGTPQDEDGSADLRHVLNVASGIGEFIKEDDKVIIDKSTVPVGTGALVRKEIEAKTKHTFHVVSNPEFLKEGAAIDDFKKPDRVVIGVESAHGEEVMQKIYKPFLLNNNPLIVMDVVSAELTKYAANAMLATRISFMNEISQLCEEVGADVDLVRKGIGTDSRIGKPFLYPGIGYGGSCFPKDVQALIYTAKENGVDLKISRAVEAVNADQKHSLVKKVVKHYGGSENVAGKTFALWGLAFKPKTDDVREAPALKVVGDLLEMGATIQAYDPEARETFAERFGSHENLNYVSKASDALKNADALLVCTEWSEFRGQDLEKLKDSLKAPLVFDGRNIYSPADMAAGGFSYYCIGRPPVRQES